MSRDPYPLEYTDGGGTQMVVVEPMGLTNRHWYGSGPVDFYDIYTERGLQWLSPGGKFTPTPGPIGSRFD